MTLIVQRQHRVRRVSAHGRTVLRCRYCASDWAQGADVAVIESQGCSPLPLPLPLPLPAVRTSGGGSAS